MEFRLPDGLLIGWRAKENGQAKERPSASQLKSIRMKTDSAGLALVVGALVGQGIISGCKPSTAEPTKAATLPIGVQVVQPKRGSITRNVTLPGEIKSYQQATLYAKVAGYLRTITVDKGDRVKEGDLIADIEVPEMLADLARYKAEVEVAELDYHRLSESQKKLPDLVVPQTVDNAKGKLDVAKASLERTETLLGFARITAPFSGVITKRMVDPGAFIPAATSGSAAQNAAMVTLADFNRVRVQVAVPEMEASHIATDQPVKVTADGLPGRSFDGKITRFSYTLDEATKTMLAEIELPNPNLELRPGMYAIVKIGIERKEDALLVPVDALVVERASAFVFTVNDHQARKTRVQTGFNDGTNAEIVSGVKPEQPVILVGKRVLSDGQAVKPSEAK
jgi:membrane fusion protein (multidrug efflux system)